MTRHDLQWIRKLNISESVLITVYLLTAVPCLIVEWRTLFSTNLRYMTMLDYAVNKIVHTVLYMLKI